VAETLENSAVRNLRLASIVIALLVCVFSAAISWSSWQHESRRQSDVLSVLAEIAAQSMDAYFLGLQATLRVASRQILDADDKVDIVRAQDLLQQIKASRPELVLTLAMPDGQIIASTARMQGFAPASLEGQPGFIALRDEKLRTRDMDMSIGRVFFGPLTREWIIPMGIAVRTRTGELALILGAGLPVAEPQAQWKDAPLQDGAALGLRRDDGYVLLRHPAPTTRSLQTFFAAPSMGPLGVFLRDNDKPERGRVVGRSVNIGEDTLYVFRRLSSFPLTLFVSNPVSNIRAMWWERVRALYALILLLLLGGYFVYRWTLRRQLSWDSERTRQMGELRTANRELEDFAYTIAHDLKAPVRAIDGNAGIALQTLGADASDMLRHRLGKIRSSASRMAELIDDLLEFSRYSRAALDSDDVDMEALARKVAEEQVPPDAGVELSIGSMPHCTADARLMRVVWTALVSNAVKYSRNSPQPLIEIGYVDGGYFVRDNGVGFDMAHVGKLFGVFSRLHGNDEFEGTGAGLAIARRILERHAGTIEAQAVPGRGATFRFTVGRAQVDRLE
jgi:signal transduction histidine kinase